MNFRQHNQTKEHSSRRRSADGGPPQPARHTTHEQTDAAANGKTFAHRVELEQLRAAFDHLDEEGNGLIGPVQLKQLLLNIVQTSGGSQNDVYRILVSLDKRG